eukprot:gene1053-1597_t
MIAGRRDNTIKACLNFENRALWTRGISELEKKYHLRPKCLGCHRDIDVDILKESSDGCMVLRCEGCTLVFCGFCLRHSGDVAEVCKHATQCRHNPCRPSVQLPASISLEKHFERLVVSRMNEPSIYGGGSP